MCRDQVWVCVCVYLVQMCAAHRLLVVFPGGGGGAGRGDPLVDTLLADGHEVTYVTPHTALQPGARLTCLVLGSLAGPDKERPSLADEVRSPGPPQRAMEAGTAAARRALEHAAMQELLADTELTFDLVVAEWYYTGLLAPLAAVYGCPLVWYSGGDASWLRLRLVHGYVSSAYSLDPLSRSAALEYGVVARARRLLRQAYIAGWAFYMMCYVEAPLYAELYQAALSRRGRSLADYEELVYNGSMLLIDSHPLVGQALPLPPNAKYIGGHHIDVPTKSLPKNLKQLLDRSTSGVILFSLGPDIKGKDLPERTKRKLLDLFGHLEQTVIWKFEEALVGLPRNVHILNGASQTSILNHTNTVLLITHGELTSCMEATYFGVPIIGIPLHDEQFLTMELVSSRGRGVRVDFTHALPYRLYDAIHHVLGNVSYRSNARQASEIYTQELALSASTLRLWAGLALVPGGASPRPPPALALLQEMHLDVLAVGGMILWFCSKVVKVIRVHWNSDDVDDDRKNR